ncbi:MAG: hypothetical protein PHY26_04825 [Bacilli bacterium]|jgi:hypothetical protein|nr:hypothetical protein [Bacilli bacterium]
MKKEYNANDLYVGKIMIVINDDFDLMVSTTELKYIFERVRSIINKGRELYEEIATGVKMETEAVQHKNGACAMTMNYPYIVELEPFINYFPYNRDQKVTGKSML